MTEVEEFEVCKKDYILKALAHLHLLENLSYESFGKIGTKGILANSRLEATTSYNNMMACISEIKTRLQLPASKPSVQQPYNVS